MAMSGEWRRVLAGALSEAEALIRASDTFTFATTDVAKGLASRATQGREAIELLEKEVPTRIPGAGLELDRVLRLAAWEAGAQQKLADWLRRVADQTTEGGED
jgi:hypothetical protein